MHFTNQSTKTKWLFNLSSEAFNVVANISEKDKEVICNELSIIQELENNNILSNYLLSYAFLYGNETKYQLFIDIFKGLLKEDEIYNSRRKDSRIYSY